MIVDAGAVAGPLDGPTAFWLRELSFAGASGTTMALMSTLDPTFVLARAASHIRSERLKGRENLERDVAYADGMAAAFEQAGYIDSSDRGMWEERFDEAAAIDCGELDWTPPEPIQPEPLVRLICGTIQPQPFLDGGIVIPVIEVLATNTAVHWRLNPPASVNAVLGPEAGRINRDLGGASDPTAPELEELTVSAFAARFNYLVGLNVRDDAGTQYSPVTHRYSIAGGSAWPAIDDLWGVSLFTPTVPANAGRISVAVRGAEFRFSI